MTNDPGHDYEAHCRAQDGSHPLPDFSLPCVECGAPVYLGDEDEHGAEFATWCERCAARETEEDEASP